MDVETSNEMPCFVFKCMKGREIGWLNKNRDDAFDLSIMFAWKSEKETLVEGCDINQRMCTKRSTRLLSLFFTEDSTDIVTKPVYAVM